ncbi:ArsC family reductase [Bermanella marisrubri]|uniref:Arsenate reductase n=1 Tax=Bermanella marisrubri TaxID=207949 RepID=Q1N1X8_9GAMM|nr:ArsC family reductase [Bermanella marisrubri]EAT12153.1 arsenate reductase [Oceanobacter sp. RED65] [Bermanella marisrubri]QIZ83629.1 ArsC family reductase [Bermanella marisrubri]
MKMYGIKNCDTIKKAQKWLQDAGIEFEFHDFKKQGIDAELAETLLKNIDYSILINKRGTTWRQLDDVTKNSLDESLAKQLMLENPSIIKRPVLEHNGQYMVGFKANDYQSFTQ